MLDRLSVTANTPMIEFRDLLFHHQEDGFRLRVPTLSMLLFRHKLTRPLQEVELLTEERTEFSIHNRM